MTSGRAGAGNLPTAKADAAPVKFITLLRGVSNSAFYERLVDSICHVHTNAGIHSEVSKASKVSRFILVHVISANAQPQNRTILLEDIFAM